MIDDADSMTSSKPYLIRAIYDWILDNQMTPHLVVDAAFPGALVPMEFVDDGRIVLNISPSAVKGLVIGNDWIQFNARFSGSAREVMVPSEAAIGIFTRENGQGMVFPEPRYPDVEPAGVDAAPAPRLKPIADASGEAGGGPSPTAPRDKGKGKGRGPTLKVVK
ncbi:ClpXP protease specificity-enhancing factor [Thiocystis violacea]|uniref:ClpXP protease specificity-enhancing factor n=1 Tax=Thiocystis violacea TaxID=13725 RepID=UPI0019057C56|nr:ClpXP protease specificity-enhancing factor [Thiocystis violacea]MBK1722406.1 ClpXP protease specificity-enhancing factor [Thiocystis violacea]